MQRSSDGYVLVFPSLLNLEECGVNGKLRWSVCVYQSAVALGCSRHLLSSDHEVVHRQIWVLLQQHLSELRGVASSRDAVVYDELVQQFHVLSRLLWHDV